MRIGDNDTVAIIAAILLGADRIATRMTNLAEQDSGRDMMRLTTHDEAIAEAKQLLREAAQS